jgi:hypothetical protein
MSPGEKKPNNKKRKKGKMNSDQLRRALQIAIASEKANSAKKVRSTGCFLIGVPYS